MRSKPETFESTQSTAIASKQKHQPLPRMPREFQDLDDPIGTFERLFRVALGSLLLDLADAPWYIREREIVNLFVFRHLVPQFQAEQLDIAQIGIEVPVLKVTSGEGERPGIYADIAVWPHKKATIWQTCKPIARVEWKNISCRELRTSGLERKHREDIHKLEQDCEFAFTNFAVLTRRHHGAVELSCKKIASGFIEDFCRPIRCNATGDEATFKELTYQDLLNRPQACPQCLSCGKGKAIAQTQTASSASDRPQG